MHRLRVRVPSIAAGLALALAALYQGLCRTVIRKTHSIVIRWLFSPIL